MIASAEQSYSTTPTVKRHKNLQKFYHKILQNWHIAREISGYENYKIRTEERKCNTCENICRNKWQKNTIPRAGEVEYTAILTR